MSVSVTYAIVCDQCGARMTASRKSPCLLPHKAYTGAWNKAKTAGWVIRNFGSKGDRHYCRGCVQNDPDLATWMMQKVLTR